MKRKYEKVPILRGTKIATLLFALFVAFVGYKILTPPSEEVYRVNSPDGSKTAQLRKIHYVSQPSYKINYRNAGKIIWQNILYLPSYTNVPYQTAVEALKWSYDSRKLDFIINDKTIWQYSFDEG